MSRTRPPLVMLGRARDEAIAYLWQRGRNSVEIADALAEDPPTIANHLARLADLRHEAGASPAPRDGTPPHRFDMPGPLP